MKNSITYVEVFRMDDDSVEELLSEPYESWNKGLKEVEKQKRVYKNVDDIILISIELWIGEERVKKFQYWSDTGWEEEEVED